MDDCSGAVVWVDVKGDAIWPSTSDHSLRAEILKDPTCGSAQPHNRNILYVTYLPTH